MLLVFIFAFSNPSSSLTPDISDLVSFPNGDGTDLHGLRMLKGKHMNLTNLDMPLGSGHGLLSILWESFRIPQGRSY